MSRTNLSAYRPVAGLIPPSYRCPVTPGHRGEQVFRYPATPDNRGEQGGEPVFPTPVTGEEQADNRLNKFGTMHLA